MAANGDWLTRKARSICRLLIGVVVLQLCLAAICHYAHLDDGFHALCKHTMMSKLSWCDETPGENLFIARDNLMSDFTLSSAGNCTGRTGTASRASTSALERTIAQGAGSSRLGHTLRELDYTLGRLNESGHLPALERSKVTSVIAMFDSVLPLRQLLHELCNGEVPPLNGRQGERIGRFTYDWLLSTTYWPLSRLSWVAPTMKRQAQMVTDEHKHAVIQEIGGTSLAKHWNKYQMGTMQDLHSCKGGALQACKELSAMFIQETRHADKQRLRTLFSEILPSRQDRYTKKAAEPLSVAYYVNITVSAIRSVDEDLSQVLGDWESFYRWLGDQRPERME